jgi:hypothetical protein
LLLHLVQSPIALTAAIVTLALTNWGIAFQTQRAITRQSVIRFSDAASASTTGATTVISRWRFALPSLVLAGIVAALAFTPSRLMREAIGGGYVVLQLTTVVINLDSLFRMRALGIVGAAEGTVHLSASYRFRAAAGQAFALGLLDAAIAWLFNSITFVVGALFVMATHSGGTGVPHRPQAAYIGIQVCLIKTGLPGAGLAYGKQRASPGALTKV